MRSSAVTEVRLRLPEGWRDIDPQSPTLDDDVERALREVWQADDTDLLYDVLATFGDRLRSLLARPGVLLVGFAGMLVRSPEPAIAQANVVLTVLPNAADAAGLRPAVADRERDLTVRLVTLPSGDAVVAFGRSETAQGPVFRAEYHVPVPGSGLAVMLAFRTPNVELADAYRSVFDAVAASLEFGQAAGSPT